MFFLSKKKYHKIKVYLDYNMHDLRQKFVALIKKSNSR